MNKEDLLQIGELAKATELNVSALRYYEEVELLLPCYKSESGYRYYQASDVSLVEFIKKSQALGFSLEEIKDILAERQAGKSPCPKVRSIAKKKIRKLEKQIKELQTLEQKLKDYIVESKEDFDSRPDAANVCHMITKANKA